jgi:hypothetical protein
MAAMMRSPQKSNRSDPQNTPGGTLYHLFVVGARGSPTSELPLALLVPLVAACTWQRQALQEFCLRPLPQAEFMEGLDWSGTPSPTTQ